MSAVALPDLLILEDDTDLRDSLQLEFSERGYVVHLASSLDSLEARLQQLPPGQLRFGIVDLRLGQDSGLNAITQILTHSPACRLVVLTGYGSIATAVAAVKQGAVNYLTKPVPIERLEAALWMDSDSLMPEARFESLDRHEQNYLEYVLLQCQGNISEAARRLGLHRQSLQRKLKRLGID